MHTNCPIAVKSLPLLLCLSKFLHLSSTIDRNQSLSQLQTTTSIQSRIAAYGLRERVYLCTLRKHTIAPARSMSFLTTSLYQSGLLCSSDSVGFAYARYRSSPDSTAR